MHEKNARTLALLIRLCDDLAWGRPADEDALFALTREGSSSPELERLAEAFGMMIVKVEAREFHRAELLEKVDQLSQELEKSRLRLHEENRQVVETLQKEYNVRRIIGRCPAMRQVVAQALAIARRPINTLILGPSGTGKEIFAKTIHYHSPRRDAPFVAVNCTAIPDSLFESEMFGIEKGVATGVSARRGLVEEASGGTLFLDELADMSLPNQAKLLRVLEEREVLRVGSARPVPVDIKVIAATNVDLRQAVAQGRFRQDLYYRLNVAELTLPPLHERGDDILLLARHLLAQHAHNMERSALSLAPATQQCLLAYDWPGNVRELKNFVEYGICFSEDGRGPHRGYGHPPLGSFFQAAGRPGTPRRHKDSRYIPPGTVAGHPDDVQSGTGGTPAGTAGPRRLPGQQEPGGGAARHHPGRPAQKAAAPRQGGSSRP